MAEALFSVFLLTVTGSRLAPILRDNSAVRNEKPGASRPRVFIQAA